LPDFYYLSQLHCPQSCKYSLLWNSWARRTLDIQVRNAEEFQDTLIAPDDLYSISLKIKSRLTACLSGLHVSAIILESPSEFLGLVGLAEMALYSLRLIVILFELYEMHDYSLITTNLINEVDNHLSRHDGDRIMRGLKDWALTIENLLELIPSEDIMAANLQSQRGECTQNMTCNDKKSGNLVLQLEEAIATLSGPDKKIELNQEQLLISPIVELASGALMPRIGLGTWQLIGQDCFSVVYEAIEHGYRHIDTAQAYRNEGDVGRAVAAAIARGLVERKDLFLASKVSFEDSLGSEQVRNLVMHQLNDLQTDYLDLYMLHSPSPNEQLQRDTWAALEDLVREGRIRSLGVSNFDSTDILRLLSYAKIRPSVVQNKYDVYHRGKQLDPRGDDVLRTCRAERLVLVAYSPFSAYPFVMLPAHDPIVTALATARNSTAPQLLLRWKLESGLAVIPRASTREHLVDNMVVYDMKPLSTSERNILDGLSLLVSHSLNKAG